MERQTKECGNCRRILPFSAFDRQSGQRRKKGGLQSYKSICRECAAKKNKIRLYRNKYRLITEFFNGKCHRCGAGITTNLLITVEFHHPDPKDCTANYHKMRGRTYDKILQWVKRDGVIPLCQNCHEYVGSTNFKLFKNIVLQRDLFQNTAEKIDKLITLSVDQNSKTKLFDTDKKSKVKISIKQWIRKRFIIEQMSDGICVGCHETNIFNNLPAFQLNHLNPLKKQNEWLDLHDLDSEEILKILIEEDCVWICSNCHRIVHSIFDNYSEELYKEFFPENVAKEQSSKIKQRFSVISNRVNSYRIDLVKIDFRSPMRLEISLGDTWKIYLLNLFYISKKIGNLFTLKTIVKYLGGSKHTYRRQLKILLQMKFLKVYRQKGLENRWRLTLKGSQEAEKIEKELNSTAEKLRSKIMKNRNCSD